MVEDSQSVKLVHLTQAIYEVKVVKVVQVVHSGQQKYRRALWSKWSMCARWLR